MSQQPERLEGRLSRGINDSLIFKSTLVEKPRFFFIHIPNTDTSFHTEQHEELIFIYIFPFVLFTPYRIWGEKGSLGGHRQGRQVRVRGRRSWPPLAHQALLPHSKSHLPFAT